MNELIQYIDQIDQSVITAECDVMLSLSATYQKALLISEQCDDTSVMENLLFMEGDAVQERVPNKQQIRSTSTWEKIKRFIKRLWLQIITMVSSAMLNKNLNKLEKNIKNSVDDKVPSISSEVNIKHACIQIEYDTKRFQQAGMDDGYSSFDDFMTSVDKVSNIKDSEREHFNHGTVEFVDKDVLLRLIDSYRAYFKALKDLAKRVDKYIDKLEIDDENNVYRNDNGSITDEDKARGVVRIDHMIPATPEQLKNINEFSSLIMKKLKERMQYITHIIDQHNKQFNPTISTTLYPELGLKQVTNTCRKILMKYGTRSDSKLYGFAVWDVNKSDDDKLNKIKNNPDNHSLFEKREGYPEHVIIAGYADKPNSEKWSSFMVALYGKTMSEDLASKFDKNGSFIISNE